MPKVGFVSLGCPKNLVDSEVMMGILARAGYEITPRAGDADVLVVNTCSFIAPAQQESVQSILEMAEYKKFGRAQKLIVAGCMVERYRNEIREQIPEVDAVIGTGEVEKILEACEGELRPDANDGAALPSYLYHDLTPRVLATPRHTAYIKINEGCDHPCTFCVIPQLRGKFRSRRFESVVQRSGKSRCRGRARNFADRPGHHLLRRRPRPARRPARCFSSASRRSRICTGFAFSIAIRTASRRSLLDTIAAHPRLAKYLDIPLQHASRSVLARMKRGSNGDAFLKLLERTAKRFPAFQFARRSSSDSPARPKRISASCAISYAPRNSTGWASSPIPMKTRRKSFALDRQSRRKTIARRKNTLMSLQKKISARKLRKRVGQRLQVMLEGPSNDTDLMWEARLEGMAPEIDGKVYITDFEGVNDAADLPRPGTLATVEITESNDYDLIARAVEFVAPPKGTSSTHPVATVPNFFPILTSQ